MTKKFFLKGLFAAVLSITIATIFGSSASYAEAVITRGLFTDGNDVRWEWQRVVDAEKTIEPEAISVMFYDKPAAATTIVVPSLNDVITAAGATETLNTYYVRSADEEAQVTNFPSETKRTSTADVTKLDMTNTSKVQILGVKPILNPETEAELVFGENVVIGDGPYITKTITGSICTNMTYEEYSWTSGYYCYGEEDVTIENAQDLIDGWSNMTAEEQYNLVVTPEMIGYRTLNGAMKVAEANYEPGYQYFRTFNATTTRSNDDGAFEGYKLKLTGLDNVKYLGWQAFKDSTLNETSRAVTIRANQTAGEAVFAGTNVNSVKIEGNEVFPKMFAECNDLTTDNIDFGTATIIGYSAFTNTALGNINLENTNIKIIRDYAFANSSLTSVHFGNVEEIGSYAFANNDLSEIYLPKSINKLDGAIFIGNINLKKATVAYDTLTTGTKLQFCIVLDGDWFDGAVRQSLEEIVVLAPYEENEEVKPTHISYAEYRDTLIVKPSITLYNNWYYNRENMAEDAYSGVSGYKNIVAPVYFGHFPNLKKITVGDGMEYLGNAAFLDHTNDDGHTSWEDMAYRTTLPAMAPSVRTSLDKVTLPESLKGVGNMVITSVFNENFEMNLPSGLEYIGFAAFRRLFFWDGDVDFPNLRFLGDYAFYSTKARDVYLHDKMEYLGVGVFNDCPALHDMTFDYDVFSPDTFPWWMYGSTSQRNHRTLFGTRFDRYHSPEFVEYYGFDLSGNDRSSYTINSITFTENSIHTMPALCETGVNCSQSSIAFFDYITVNKVDMGKAGWDFIPVYAFQDSYLGEVILPENLKEIHSAAFMDTEIAEELVLPETLEVIEDGAFSQYYEISHNGKPTIKITKLPKSLKTIGAQAFCSDDRLVIDELDLPNLEFVGVNAFAGATIKRVVLHDSIKTLQFGAFYFIKGLEDLVIDFDFFSTSAYNLGFGLMRGAVYISGLSMPSYYYPFHLQTFFSLFEPYEYEPGRYGNPANFGVEDTRVFNSIVFTEKSKTQPGIATFNSDIPAPCEFGEYSEYHCYYEDGRVNWNSRPKLQYFASTFYGVRAKELDLSAAEWSNIPNNAFNSIDVETLKLPSALTTIYQYAFYGASVDNPIEIPAGITYVGTEAFQYADVELVNAFAEGLTRIDNSAFYGARVRGDITIPSTMDSVGFSAFNAGDADTDYGTVTIKPSWKYSQTADQSIFQLFWNAKMDKLVIESPMLPVLGTLQEEPVLPSYALRADGEPEFHGMTMREVVISNLPAITANAFEECGNLEKVSFEGNSNLSEIGRYAFNNDTKLKTFVFGDELAGSSVALKEFAFNNTAVETIGTTNETDFNLAAANFHTVNEHVFSNMPKLTTVDIPNNFNIDESLANEEKFVNGAHITSFTFANDPELEEVTIGYQIAEIRDGAFLNDEKLAKLFVWGNAEIQESDDLIHDFNNTTIPKGTTIFGYSDAPVEAYANAASRDNYDGKFYALDEVLYLTSNRAYVVLTEDKEDFKKDDLKLYALRRDGVILESDEWQQYTTAFPRVTAINIVFEGRGALGDDNADITANIYDAPKPFNTISLANQNYANVDFEFMQMPSSNNPLVAIHYPDGYTGNIRTTTLASMTKEEEEEYLAELEVPNTGVFLEVMKVATPAVSLSAIVVAGALLIAKKRH